MKMKIKKNLTLPQKYFNEFQNYFHNAHDYLYLRDNPAGEHSELWYHEYGDRSWLVVTRDTNNHEILKVEHVKDYIKSYKAIINV